MVWLFQCLWQAVETVSWKRLRLQKILWRPFVGVTLVRINILAPFCLIIYCVCWLTLNSKCLFAFFSVVKLRLTQLKYTPTSLSQFALAAKLDVLKHGPLLGGQIRSHIELWLERDATCVRNMTRHQPRGGTFLVTGTVQAGRLVVNKAYAWHRRDKNLMAAARKWKHHRCRS